MQMTEEMLQRFYDKLDSIETELKSLSHSLTITIERQTVTHKNLNKLENRVETVEAHTLKCPARKSYESKGILLRDWTALIAFVISLAALYGVFFK